MINKNDSLILISGIILLPLLFAINLYIGDVEISWSKILKIISGGTVENNSWSFIIQSRLNRTLVALASGSALALSGLILQVYFRNPLAGPGVLGITSGASLGVALVILGGLSTASFLGNLGIVSAGISGAILVLILLLVVSRFLQNSVTLLVVGLLFGYFTSAIINVLFLWANLTDTRAYVVWGLGSFEGTSPIQLITFLVLVGLTILCSFFLVKSLNALVLGSEYAASLGINLKRTRFLILCITGVLAAIVTVYCGPISFIGIAVPQLVRMMVKSKNHAVIIPFTLLTGAVLALTADIIVRLSGNSIPLNSVTALIGTPVIIYTIIKMNSRIA